ncbi:MAG: ADP-ribosylglycohydrolase family protein, partial [Chloroflexi bacterium]|nr:ADP-ribosylglycohydrolase family protein [Chloroflexota bacterium]
HFNQQIVRHSAMTHFTDISAHAALIHVHGVYHCLFSGVDHYTNDSLLDLISDQVWEWGEAKNKGTEMYYQVNNLRKHPTEKDDGLEDRMIWLFQQRKRLEGMERDEIRNKFGNGECYVLHSIPFTYTYFLKNPYTPQAIIDVIEAGGDTDTNGKMVGELVGALNGIEVFQTKEWKWLCDGLLEYDKLIKLADQFCETFGIQ